jgi:hypothetical protein
MCWIRYTGGSTLDSDSSYAQDYIIHDNLEIEEIGEPYPIWEVPECTAVQKYIDNVKYSLEYQLNDDFYNEYDDVTYEVDCDQVIKAFNIIAYNTDHTDEDVRKFAYDYSYKLLKPDQGIFTGYTINVEVFD